MQQLFEAGGPTDCRRVRRRMLGAALGGTVPVALRAGARVAGGWIGAAGAEASTGTVIAQASTVPGVERSATSLADAASLLDSAIRTFTGGAAVRAGKVRLQIAPLVDNGNTVPLSISVDHPMRPDDHVAALAVFSERNPQHEVARFGLGPRIPTARVSTRIRLATSQKLVAIARLSDDSYWSGEVDVIVTLAACIED